MKKSTLIIAFLLTTILLGYFWFQKTFPHVPPALSSPTIFFNSVQNTITPTETPISDEGKQCSDGSECSSNWCVDMKCTAYPLRGSEIGDYKPTNIYIHGKIYAVSGLGDQLFIPLGDMNDASYQILIQGLCNGVWYKNETIQLPKRNERNGKVPCYAE